MKALTSVTAVIISTMLFFGGDTLAGDYRLLHTYPLDVKEPSGLTYDSKTDTLWTVRDGGGGIYQLDKQGKVLQMIDIGANDLEGIAYKPDSDTFLLAEERHRELVEINRKGKILRTIKVPIKWHYWHLNHGIEGVCYDPKRGRIFIVNEKAPKKVMELDKNGTVLNSFEVDDTDDLSGIYCDETGKNLLVLSHETKAVMEFTTRGEFQNVFFVEDIPQAEGITKDKTGNMYIVCDKSRTLYVYAPIKK